MTALMTTRFRLVLLAFSAALALVLSLAMVATVAADNHPNYPHELTGELCDDAVCLSWTPGARDFDYQRVLAWKGNNLVDRNSGYSATIDVETSEFRVPLEDLDIEPTENLGETMDYSFLIIGVELNVPGIGDLHINSNPVTLSLPRPDIDRTAPYGLTAERCGDAVCLSWTPGEAEFNHQQVRAWEGEEYTGDSPRITRSVGVHASETRLPLDTLKIKPGYSSEETARYSFQVIGVYLNDNNEWGYSNIARLRVPRPIIDRVDPSGLTAELCKESVCVSWTPGEGDYNYQGVKFWQTDRPDDSFHHGGVAIITTTASIWEFPIDRIRRHPGDQGEVSHTFRVEAVTRQGNNYIYVGYSNEVLVDIPVHLMAPVDPNEKR